MAKTRKVKDAKDLYTDELIYFTGHAKATYMSDGSTVEDSISNIKHLIELTYSELKELRTNSKLIPGCKYRITDFVTTTNGKESSSSAGHQFDIVVTALAANTLDENAKVLPHDGDTYFSNNAVSTWDIKYILDNNESRFNWANSTGKGVIYYMKDEYGNVASYDFKNIMFNGKYTFSYTINNTLYDGSVKYGKVCYNNFICGDLLSYASYKGLPKVYFDNTSETSNCYNNVVLENCWDITFGNNCYNNKVNSECEALRIGNDCHSNEFGVLCKSVNIENKSNITIDRDTNGNIIQYYNGDILNKQDKLVSGENIKTVNGKSILGEGNIDLNNLIEVTYSELKSLRDNSILIPGSYYRITDYVTTVTSLKASSAGHKFDLIVLALTEKTLSENAIACNHKFIEREPNSFGVAINYGNDFYYVFDGWKSWGYDNLPENLKKLINIDTPVKRQLFQKNLKAGELRIKLATRCHRSNSKNSSYTYEIPCLGIDLCSSSINENEPETWNDYIVSSDYHLYTSSTPGSLNNSDITPGNTDVEYILNVPKDGTYTICIAVDDTNDILNNSSNPLRSELGVYGEVFEIIEKDNFKNVPVDSWEIKYCLDNDITRFNWANQAEGKGVIYYMKDEHENECPYDFKNILFNGYYTFSYIINNVIYDGTVKYNTCYGNKIQPAYNSDNIRILNGNIFKNTSGSSFCISNTFENDCTDNIFGDSCISNAFGNYCKNNTFGNNCQYNTFEDYCITNTFGSYCQSNTFGVYCQSNSFGSYIIRCTFGKQCISNKFTNGSGTNLDACRMISLGDQCSSVNIYTTESPSYNTGKWLQNIDIANTMSGSIEVNNINGTRIKYIIKDANNNIVQYYKGDFINKQDKLVSGENIITVNGNSILTSGNIIAGDISFEYTELELDDPE